MTGLAVQYAIDPDSTAADVVAALAAALLSIDKKQTPDGDSGGRLGSLPYTPQLSERKEK